MVRTSIVVGIVLSILFAGAASSAPPPRVGVFRNLPYARVDGVDPRLLSLDIYTSGQAMAARPVVVMIHGGGWRSGDKARRPMTQPKAPHFVGHGFVYVSINYRLSKTANGAKHPAHVEDVAKALAWLHDHVGEHGGDPDRLFVMGHSSGAHLAALVSTDHRRLEAEGKDLSIIKGTICLDTAGYDIPRYINELAATPRARRAYEHAFGATEDVWRDASPRHHVAPDKDIPPMLLFHTGQRKQVKQLSNEMAAALRDAGTPARAIHAADKDHAGINRCIGEPGDPYTKIIMAFLGNLRGEDEDEREDDSTQPGG